MQIVAGLEYLNSLVLYLDLTHWCFPSFLRSEKRPKQRESVTTGVFYLPLPAASFEKSGRRLLGLLKYSICQGKNLSRAFLCTFLIYMGIHGSNLLDVCIWHSELSVERMLMPNKSLPEQVGNSIPPFWSLHIQAGQLSCGHFFRLCAQLWALYINYCKGKVEYRQSHTKQPYCRPELLKRWTIVRTSAKLSTEQKWK